MGGFPPCLRGPEKPTTRITGSSSPISHMGSPAQMAKECPWKGKQVDEVHAAHSTQSLDSASSPGMHWDAAQEGPWSQNSEQCPCRCTSLSTAPLPLSCPPRIRTFLCLSSYMHSSAAPLEIWICRAGTWLWGQIWGEAFPTPRKEAITSGHCGLTVFAVPWSGPCLPAAMINPSLSSQDRRADDCIMT